MINMLLIRERLYDKLQTGIIVLWYLIVSLFYLYYQVGDIILRVLRSHL